MRSTAAKGRARAAMHARERLGDETSSSADDGAKRRKLLPAPPTATEMVPGWRPLLDPGSGSIYYYSLATGETRWHAPVREVLQRHWSVAEDRFGIPGLAHPGAKMW